MTMAAMAPGPSEPAETRGAREPRADPPACPAPCPPPPAAPRTAALVQTLLRGAVLGALRAGGGGGTGGRGLPAGAGVLRGTFSGRQLSGLVPQGGHGLLWALG